MSAEFNIMVKYVDRTDVGLKRKVNQDKILINSKIPLFVIADGVGGYEGGEIASELAAKNIEDYSLGIRHEKDIDKELGQAMIYANYCIYEEAMKTVKYSRMATTATAVIIKKNKLYYAHMGDCRIYLIRNKKMKRYTKDHTRVQELIDNKIISSGAIDSNIKNIVTRLLGPDEEIEPDTGKITLMPEDMVIMSTDGFHGEIEEEIKCLINNNINESLNTLADRLLKTALKKDGSDNISFILIKID